MLGLFSVGIAAGSVLCSKAKFGRKIVAIGAIGLTIFGSLLVFLARDFSGGEHTFTSFIATSAAYPIMLVMLAIGFFGGFFSVPLYTRLQTAASDEFRAQAIAANNIVNAIFMVMAAIGNAILLALFDSILLLYALVAWGNLGLLVYLYRKNAFK